MSDLFPRLIDSLRAATGAEPAASGCGCQPSFRDDTLVVDATDCESQGELAASEACRRTVVDALTERDVERVQVEAGGVQRSYEDDAAALLVAAGRFVEAATFHDQRLADRARRDPLGACHEAVGRADAVAQIAAQTGLAVLAERADGYQNALSPFVGPTVSRWRVEEQPPPGATLVATRDLPTGATVRHYESSGAVPRYHLQPPERTLSEQALWLLDRAHGCLANGGPDGGSRAPARAVRRTISGPSQADVPVEEVASILTKHARGYGLLEDLFADQRLSDAFLTPPVVSNCLRVTVDGETMRTNVRLTASGVDALASRFRRESGRAFSRADPTLDATADIAGRRIRVAGVTEPTSAGTGFAFRAHDRAIWTLPKLVGNGTITPRAGALLSIAVERGAAVLIAGPRGAGKTTMLGALLWELPSAVRMVVIEDTPELPVEPLQTSGRDVQSLRVHEDSDELSAAETLRTALRLGDGALVVGEVRGEEAAVLYEAMRVGASSEAVLGTIHGDGAPAVFERVVSDLGVAASAFAATDLVVTLETADGSTRRVKRIEEVAAPTDDSVGREKPRFEPLFDRTDADLVGTGRINRGNSPVVDALSRPSESYADVQTELTARTRLLGELADRERFDTGTGPLSDRIHRTQETALGAGEAPRGTRPTTDQSVDNAPSGTEGEAE